ncbi:preprotein translocase subunit SecG [bacterium]|nr:preprotein translocase subunit SecG [bacterium]|tara:strand:- start:308 stop:517 length:210 start_codon:yes stop_codon:yes gene_type:complete
MFLDVIQVIIAVLLIAVILLQNRGTGLGGAFGGGGEVFTAKRGPEKKLYYATIVLAIAFLLTALLNVVL